MGSLSIALNCYVFPLGGVDVILGISWLEMLGDVKVNWQWLTMWYRHNRVFVTLQGNSSLVRTPVPLHCLLTILELFCFEGNLSMVLPLSLGPRSQQLSALINQFPTVFSDAVSLLLLGILIITFPYS